MVAFIPSFIYDIEISLNYPGTKDGLSDIMHSYGSKIPASILDATVPDVVVSRQSKFDISIQWW